jgi:hypothetical protein
MAIHGGRFRKKPVMIEAILFDGTVDRATLIIDWILENDGVASYHEHELGNEPVVAPRPFISIPTLEGTMTAEAGDWVIKEPFPTEDRRFYPCKASIFAQTYELWSKGADGDS